MGNEKNLGDVAAAFWGYHLYHFGARLPLLDASECFSLLHLARAALAARIEAKVLSRHEFSGFSERAKRRSTEPKAHARTSCFQMGDGNRDLRLRSGVYDVQSRHPLNTRIRPHIAEVVSSSSASCAGELSSAADASAARFGDTKSQAVYADMRHRCVSQKILWPSSVRHSGSEPPYAPRWMSGAKSSARPFDNAATKSLVRITDFCSVQSASSFLH